MAMFQPGCGGNLGGEVVVPRKAIHVAYARDIEEHSWVVKQLMHNIMEPRVRILAHRQIIVFHEGLLFSAAVSGT